MYKKHIKHFDNASRRHVLRQNYLPLAQMPPCKVLNKANTVLFNIVELVWLVEVKIK